MTPSSPTSTTADQDWPEPVETLGIDGRSPIVLLCEHASNHLPPEYADLGVQPADLQRHIAWDIGAADLTRHLSGMLDAPAFLGKYSRLLIDLNRPLAAASSILTLSEATDVPGNVGLTPAERMRRERRIFAPYHAAIRAHLQERSHAGRKTFIVAIHSFTPVFLGTARPWHVGVLFGKAAALAEATMTRLRAEDSSLSIGPNVPYTVSPEETCGLLVHGDDIGNPAILIEIRQDLIATPPAAESWAKRLAPVLADVCN